jgi:transcriptional regulator with XRE-family HTH domain
LHIFGRNLTFYSVKSGSDASDRLRIASLLRDLRLAKELRQTDVAERIGETQSYVSRYENGEQRLDLVELRAICRALGTSLPSVISRLELD